jgi:hypothetical protein
MDILDIFEWLGVPSGCKLFGKTDQFCTAIGGMLYEWFHPCECMVRIFPGARDLCAAHSHTLAVILYLALIAGHVLLNSFTCSGSYSYRKLLKLPDVFFWYIPDLICHDS